MAGKKGRSGRQPEIVKINYDALTRDSVSVVRALLIDPSTPLDVKAKIAVQVVCKGMPSKNINDNKNSGEIKVEISRAELEDRIKNLFGGRVCIGQN